jgi:hypothetical protein
LLVGRSKRRIYEGGAMKAEEEEVSRIGRRRKRSYGERGEIQIEEE